LLLSFAMYRRIWTAVVVLVISGFLWWTYVDINLVLPLQLDVQAASNEVSVMVWNTELWAEAHEREEFLQFISLANADVYMLQEAWNQDLTAYLAVDEVKQALPNYYIWQSEEFVIASRFEIVGDKQASTVGYFGGYARVDLQI